jgi:2,4-dienoyl-CoA reductase-like NADH-dependent reductase (Old Yellow Enzyme family)
VHRAGDVANLLLSQSSSSLTALTLGAIGVVYGDIGTSVLYAVKEVFGSGHSLSGLAKKYAKAPVIVNGGLGDPATAASVIAAGDADVVAQGKAALGNPDWPAKVQAGASLADFDFGMFSPLADLASQAAWEAAQ